jgi:hypothetical protein
VDESVLRFVSLPDGLDLGCGSCEVSLQCIAEGTIGQPAEYLDHGTKTDMGLAMLLPPVSLIQTNGCLPSSV